MPRRNWAVVTLALGITLAVLDTSIANVALPTIASQLGISASRPGSWCGSSMPTS
jgi:DHA2 family multidrug resistance protein-like MFS transporter